MSVPSNENYKFVHLYCENFLTKHFQVEKVAKRAAIEPQAQTDAQTQLELERMKAMRPESPEAEVNSPNSPPLKVARKSSSENEKSSEMLSFLNSSTLDPSDDDEEADENPTTAPVLSNQADLQLYPKQFDAEKLKEVKIGDLLEQIATVQTDSPSADGKTRERITQVKFIFIL